MQDKTSQQQAIVRARDENNKHSRKFSGENKTMKAIKNTSDKSEDNSSLVPNPYEHTYAEIRKNQKTGATTETAIRPTGEVVKLTETKSGVKIGEVMKAPKFSSKQERNDSIRDLHKNGIKQIDNAKVHNVSQATVSNEVNKKK